MVTTTYTAEAAESAEKIEADCRVARGRRIKDENFS